QQRPVHGRGLSVGMAPAQQQPDTMVSCSILLVGLCSECSSSSQLDSSVRGRVEVWPGLVVLAGTSHLVRTSVCHADNAAAEGLLRRLRLYIHRTVWWRGVTPTLGRITLRDNILPMIIGNTCEHEGIEPEQGMIRSRCAATHI